MDIKGGEWSIYFSDNLFGFNAVYHDKGRTVAVSLNLRETKTWRRLGEDVFSHKSKLDLSSSNEWSFST